MDRGAGLARVRGCGLAGYQSEQGSSELTATC